MARRKHEIVADRYILRALYLKPNGQWAAKIRDTETGRIREKCARAETRVDAHAEIRQWLEAVAAVEGGGIVGVPFTRALDEFLGAKDIRETTRAYYQKQRARLVEGFGEFLTTGVRLAEVEAWIATRRSRGNAPRTIGMQIGLLRGFFRWARRRGYADRDPTDGIRLGGYRPSGRALTPREARRLVAAAAFHGPLRLWILIGLYTGLRSRNIWGLTWGHIDFERGRVAFGPEETKGGRPLTVPLHPVLAATLRAEFDGLRVVRLSAPVVGETTFRKSWARALSASETAPLRPHDLRHTFASWVALRASYAVQQALLGHAPQGVTATYTHVPWPALVRAIRRLPDLTRAAAEKDRCITPA